MTPFYSDIASVHVMIAVARTDGSKKQYSTTLAQTIE